MIGRLSISPWGKTAQSPLVWAYDCFPFGMLMPGRFISDTNSHCLLVSRSTWTTTMVDTCYPVAVLTGTASVLGVASFSSSEGIFAAAAPNATDGVILNQTVASSIDNVLTFDVVDLKDGDEEGVLVTVLETIDNVPYVIGGGRLRQGKDQRINFRATGNNIQVVLNGPYTNLVLAQVCTRYARSTAQTYLVEVCDDAKDKYRFGFNTQEKVNEIAGVGNHNTAFFGELDTRLARRWNLDPKPNPSWSSYSVFLDNPIYNSDVLLDTPSHTPQTGKCEGCKVEKLEDGDYFSDAQDQKYTLKMTGVTQSQFDKFKAQMSLDPGIIINNSKAKYDLIDRDGSYGVTKGDHFDIKITPDNGSVQVSAVVNKPNFLSVTVQTLRGHPDAGENTFMTSYDPNTQTMTWQTHNISRSNDFILQGIGAGIFMARSQQQQQWRNVMKQVYQYMGKPVIEVANQTIINYKYDDYNNKLGRSYGFESTPIQKEISK
ncbi:MAG TPA: DUF1990 family protein [Edaphocola sp.]|nr:DUF1990 family protein [Edaphocola sp.]